MESDGEWLCKVDLANRPFIFNENPVVPRFTIISATRLEPLSEQLKRKDEAMTELDLEPIKNRHAQWSFDIEQDDDREFLAHQDRGILLAEIERLRTDVAELKWRDECNLGMLESCRQEIDALKQ